MSDAAGPPPATPPVAFAATALSYDAGPRRGDSVFGLIGLALAVVCAALPAYMLVQLLTPGGRRSWPAYTPYAGDIGSLHLGRNWPWFALDTVALLLGVVALCRGRRRCAVAAITMSAASLVTVMTLVLGSPWW